MGDMRKSLLIEQLFESGSIDHIQGDSALCEVFRDLIQRLEYRALAHVYEDFGIDSLDEFKDFINTYIGPLSNYEINTVNALRDEYEEKSR